MKSKISPIMGIASLIIAGQVAADSTLIGADSNSVGGMRSPGFFGESSMGTGSGAWGHEATQDIDMDGYSIINLRDPQADHDAVTKGYVDGEVANSGDNLGNHAASENLKMNGFSVIGLGEPTTADSAVTRSFVEGAVANGGDNLGSHKANKSLDMSGHAIIAVGDPVGERDAASKRYVDDRVSQGRDNLGDHTATQALNMNGFPVANLPAPNDPDDAATKDYVDNVNTQVVDGVDEIKSRRVNAGAGLTGGGDLSSDVTIGFDVSWGDQKYADKSRRVGAGQGLTGGGDLSSDRTISFDTLWGDSRYLSASSKVTAGDGLSGGGDLKGDPVMSVDSTVARTTGATFTGPVDFSLNGNPAAQIDDAGTEAIDDKTVITREKGDERYAFRQRKAFAGNGYIALVGVKDGNWKNGTYIADYPTINEDGTATGGVSLEDDIIIHFDPAPVHKRINDKIWNLQKDNLLYRKDARDSLPGVLAYGGSTRTNWADGHFNSYPESPREHMTTPMNYEGQLLASGVNAYTHWVSADKAGKYTRHASDILPSKGMEEVRQLQPKTFMWSKSKRRSRGFFAEDVEALYPGDVHEPWGDGHKYLNYDALLAPMVAAIQDLDARLAAVEGAPAP